MRLLLLSLLLTLPLKAAVTYPDGGILTYISGLTNARPLSVTITNGTNLAAGTLTATNSVSVVASGTAGSLTLFDDDASNSYRLVPNGTTTTSINDQQPAAPFSGLVKRTITAGTNWTQSAAVAGTDYQAAFTTGVGVTNQANVLSANLVAGSNVTLTPGSNGALTIASSGGGGGSGTIALVWKDSSFLGTNTSTVEFPLYTNATAIAGNTIVTNGEIRCRFSGTLTNSTGGNVNYTFKLYFGGSVVMSGAVNAVSSSATGARNWEINWSIYGRNSMSSQFHDVRMGVGPGSVAAGNMTAENFVFGGYNRTTVDMTATASVGLTVTMGTSSANADCFYEHSDAFTIQ